MATESITCTPEALLSGTIPIESCLTCGSDRQLMAALALIMCKLAAGSSRADCSVETNGPAAACFACMDDHQMLAALVSMFLSYTVALGYMEADGTLMQDASCLICADPKLVRAIILQKLCTFMAAQLDVQ